VCNPENVSQIVPDAANTIFYDQWNPDVNSTYKFIIDSSDANYMKLVFNQIGENNMDQDGNPDNVAVGEVVKQGIWGIKATINQSTTSFNWEYDPSGMMDTITYLMDGNSYKLLNDPMRFNSISVTNLAGKTKSISLQYDGGMAGFPDLYRELEKEGHVMTQAIMDKIINLPAGTVVRETETGVDYLVKPLEISLFLSETADPDNLDLSAAQAIQLSDIQIYAEHGMLDVPNVSTVKYSEGYPVE